MVAGHSDQPLSSFGGPQHLTVPATMVIQFFDGRSRLYGHAPSLILVLAFATALSGCGSSNDPGEVDRNGIAAQIETSLGSELPGIDARNPFGVAQSTAEHTIDAAIGSSLEQTWVHKMIEHQAGAIELAKALMQTNPPPAARRAAQSVVTRAKRRTEVLESVHRTSHVDEKSRKEFGPIVAGTFTEMRRVEGGDPTKTWARKMAVYNRGAVRMSGLVVTKGSDERIVPLARNIALALANEADQIERLVGE